MGLFSLKKTAAENDKREVMEQRLRTLEDDMRGIKDNTAYISFDLSGYILEVNDIFLSVVNYARNDVVGKHHRIFCSEAITKTREYENFWRELALGKSFSGTFERVKRDGDAVFLSANYFPVKDKNNDVVKVIKIASDVTESQLALKSKNAVLQRWINHWQRLSLRPMAM